MLNAGQKYCRMLHGEHSAILSTFIKLPFVINIFVYFEWPLKTGITALLFKKSDKIEVEYQPVSILSIFSKVIERVVYDDVESYRL